MVDYDSRLARQYDLLTDRKGSEIAEIDAELIRYHAKAYDPNKRRTKPPSDDKTMAVSTVANRLQNLQQIAREADEHLTEQTAEELDELIDTWHGEISVRTLRQRQIALRKCLNHATDEGEMPDPKADPEAIYVDEQEETSVDKADLLEWEQIEELRDACRNNRDRALLEMLVYTGQRITALLTLRVKDVYPQEGTFRLNPEKVEQGGLKGAEGHRPLLGSVAAVRNWLNNGHPEPDNPDAYLFTALPTYVENPNVEETLTDSTVRAILKRMKGRTDVNKPCNPHNFRHTFVTLAYKEYGLKKGYIKKLIGHEDDSTVMETTYRHLDDDDTIKAAEQAFGLREEKDESTLTPDACLTCGQGLAPTAKACENCGTLYTPDAKEATDEFAEDERESLKQSNDPEVHEEVDTLSEKVENNPEVLLDLYEQLSDESAPQKAATNRPPTPADD